MHQLEAYFYIGGEKKGLGKPDLSAATTVGAVSDRES
jgi:hypothetical protein